MGTKYVDVRAATSVEAATLDTSPAMSHPEMLSPTTSTRWPR